MATEEDQCSKNLEKKKHLIKAQNAKLDALNIEVKSCYKYSNETAKNLEQLTSSCGNYIDQDKSQEFQKVTSVCEGNGWIIDNLFCPIANKMNEFWEPLPAWGKDATVAIGLIAAGYYLSRPPLAKVIMTVGEPTDVLAPLTTEASAAFKAGCKELLQTAFHDMKKDTGVIEALVNTFEEMTQDMDLQTIGNVLSEFISNST